MQRVAIALKSFRRSDTREFVNRNQVMEGPAAYLEELAKNGLARITTSLPDMRETKADPAPPAAPLSASPAGQASPKQTAKPSATGGKKTAPKTSVES